MTLNTLTIVLHLLAVVIWVGGMFFAYQILRPVAASQLEPPARLKLWIGIFGRFFPYVWIAVILLPVTGYLMIFNLFNGMGNAPVYIHLMNGLGTLMILIYLHVFFAPYKRLKRAVASEDWPTGGKALAQIRVLVGINASLGLIVVAIASGGRFFG
jgi:uncharacterized membrane protein